MSIRGLRGAGEPTSIFADSVLAYTLIDAGKAKVNRSGGPIKGDIQGEYDTNYLHAVNVNFVYRF